MRKIVCIAIFLSALGLTGCSGSEPTGVLGTPGSSGTPSVTASPAETQSGVESTGSTASSSSTNSGDPRQTTQSTQGQPGEIDIQETTSTSNPNPQTTMNVVPGVDAGWQNTGTAEQRARGTWDPKPEKPSNTSTVQGLGDNGAPVIDDGNISVVVR